MSTSKFPLGLLVAVVMAAGVVGLFLSHTSAQQTRTIHLAQGWNLVTWTAEKQSVSEALGGVSDAVSAIYGYNNDSQSFTRYMVGRPEISTLTDFEPEQAYWVLAQRSADWSVPGAAEPSCPTATPCLGCPCALGSWGDMCASAAMMIEFLEVELDIAEEVGVAGTTPAEVRAKLDEQTQYFDENCQGVALAEPSLLTFGCATVGIWAGQEDTASLHDFDPHHQVWANQFEQIMADYCKTQ